VRSRVRDPAASPWRGPTRPYDLVKELVVALVVVALLVLALAAVFSSPDEPGVTIQRWARADASDFVATSTTELDGTSASASYGPPYNHNGPGQKIGPVGLQKLAGIRIPIDPARDFVIGPLQTVTGDPALTAALARYTGTSATVQQRWASNYDQAIQKAPGQNPAKVSAGDYGPVPIMTARLLQLAHSGALDSQLVNRGSGFYQTDYTRPLLFLADGGYLANLADAQHLSGNQWGMTNETGSYPGQAWLWLYTFWYQVSPFTHSGNADALIWGVMAVLSLALVLVPFIPGVRSIPKLVPIHRIIWRDYYRQDQQLATRPNSEPHP
jgi:hypothetical protein